MVILTDCNVKSETFVLASHTSDICVKIIVKRNISCFCMLCHLTTLSALNLHINILSYDKQQASQLT